MSEPPEAKGQVRPSGRRPPEREASRSPMFCVGRADTTDASAMAGKVRRVGWDAGTARPRDVPSTHTRNATTTAKSAGLVVRFS